jgi:copper transport protein
VDPEHVRHRGAEQPVEPAEHVLQDRGQAGLVNLDPLLGVLAVLAVALAGRPDAQDDDPHPGRPGPAALTRFSRLALVSVAGLLATGTVNAVLRLERWSDLWDSRYGVILLVKLALVATVLTVAAVSRSAVRRGAEPRRAVAAEVAVTVLVLAVTSLLASTAPP